MNPIQRFFIALLAPVCIATTGLVLGSRGIVVLGAMVGGLVLLAGLMNLSMSSAPGHREAEFTVAFVMLIGPLLIGATPIVYFVASISSGQELGRFATQHSWTFWSIVVVVATAIVASLQKFISSPNKGRFMVWFLVIGVLAGSSIAFVMKTASTP